MNLIRTFLLLLCTVLPGCATSERADGDRADTHRSMIEPVTRTGSKMPENEPFAVVELFTSEGCSSCPPADALLTELTREAHRKGEHVYPISFHVDYWNRLGWTDPFSSPAFSARQRSYADRMGLNGVYTPQMIVNGRTEFVGSDSRRARAAISEALSNSSPTSLSLRITGRESSGKVSVGYSVMDYPEGAMMNLALVERDLTVHVPRGENSGRDLHHDNVVRAFVTVTMGPEGSGTVDLTPTTLVKPGNASVVAYVQDAETMEIVAATSADLEE